MAKRSRMKTPPRDHAQEITDRIIELLESGEMLPWRCPWRRSPASAPTRATGEAYRGINNFWLELLGSSMGYCSPFWMTFGQAKALGGSVRKGEKSAPVVYYGSAVSKESGETEERGDSDGGDEGGTEGGGRYRFLKGYAVFNADQIDGLPPQFYPTAPELDTGAKADAALDAFFAQLPVPITDRGEAAFYSPAEDRIFMPPVQRFETASHYYATALHEQAHASGAPSRLNRDTLRDYHRSKAIRAREELIAEIASAIAGPRLGLPVDHIEEHSAYVYSWLAMLKDDKRHVLRAAAEAQRAVDWIFAAAGETASAVAA